MNMASSATRVRVRDRLVIGRRHGAMLMVFQIAPATAQSTAAVMVSNLEMVGPRKRGYATNPWHSHSAPAALPHSSMRQARTPPKLLERLAKLEATSSAQ